MIGVGRYESSSAASWCPFPGCRKKVKLQALLYHYFCEHQKKHSIPFDIYNYRALRLIFEIVGQPGAKLLKAQAKFNQGNKTKISDECPLCRII
jgi:hypothetical protein